ncbi:hypothetical protein NW762_012876 [Fusarium torreyae]|uniref:Uncharacterized protein n=1 Tax=Fusarium torreyae TaxID=1237075 RepID=A0A9W8RQC4_9HYPO|nr:hypothetical protein NW762_012876 [Fusarium torreyae]
MARFIIPLALCLLCTAVQASNPVFRGCDPEINEPAVVSAAWYRYCVKFFKEFCPASEYYLEAETFDEYYSEEAIAAGGIGENENGDSGSDEKPDSGRDTHPNANAGADASTTTEPNKTTGSASKNAENTSETSETTQATNGAVHLAIPLWAVITSLWLYLIDM